MDQMQQRIAALESETGTQEPENKGGSMVAGVIGGQSTAVRKSHRAVETKGLSREPQSKNMEEQTHRWVM
jgi:hypothetical protein